MKSIYLSLTLECDRFEQIEKGRGFRKGTNFRKCHMPIISENDKLVSG